MISAINNLNSFYSIPAAGLAGKAAVTALAIATLANLPATMASSCSPDAYKACLDKCLQVFPGMDRGYDACAQVCQAKFLNPWG